MPGPERTREEESRPVDEIFSLIYEELRRLASFTRRSQGDATINTTALVHEAWLKLRNSPELAAKSIPHFKSIAAKAMRQVLVDEARRRNARKRGGAGEINFVPFDDARPIVSCDEELLALDDCLKELADLSPRQAQVVENRFFGGFSVAETAELLSVSESVVERDWRTARAWLASRVRPQTE
jgi:RNA polymerase sigma factor (TIGR02999 family)